MASNIAELTSRYQKGIIRDFRWDTKGGERTRDPETAKTFPKMFSFFRISGTNIKRGVPLIKRWLLEVFVR